MSLILDGVIIIATVGLTESILKPFSIKIIDSILLPNLGSIFEKINPNTPDWLSDPNITGEIFAGKLARILTEEIDGFADRPFLLKKWALKRLVDKYSILKNADKITESFPGNTLEASTSLEPVLSILDVVNKIIAKDEERKARFKELQAFDYSQADISPTDAERPTELRKPKRVEDEK